MKAFAIPLLALLALPAFAARTAEVLTDDYHPTVRKTSNNSNMGIAAAFDGIVTNNVSGARQGDEITIDFTGYVTTDKPVVCVTEIAVTSTGGGTYSLFTSEDGTTWDPVSAAQGVRTTGTKSYTVGLRVLYVKYVFDTTGGSDLQELTVKGWRSSKPAIISKTSLAKMYWADGTMTDKNGTEGLGGGMGIGNFFDGNFTSGVYIGPNGRLNNGGFVKLDFSSEKPNGYFITQIKTGSATTHSYSLYYSMNGSDWSYVEGGVGVTSATEKSFNVNDTAVYVKCVFDVIGGWTPTFAELQVWGMDPDDIPCMHPSYTAWSPVEGSNTCTTDGIDERFCNECGYRDTRESTTLFMLGHDYVSNLDRPGRFKAFGRGSIVCSRGDFRIDFTNTLETATTNGPINLVTHSVNGEWIGGVKTPGVIHFTDVSVTSTGNTDWGIRPGHLIGNNWTWSWNNYWYSASSDANPHVDYEFGTEIDLVYIDISLPNSTHFTRFFSVDDATGEETQLTQFFATRTDLEKGDKYHIWRAPDSNPYEDIYEGDEFDDLPVVLDPDIPSRKHDENGNEIPDNPNTDPDEGDNSYNSYQRFTLRFYEQPIRHLRIRQITASGGVMKPMYISELHPWGIVRGAGDLRYRKETILILR